MSTTALRVGCFRYDTTESLFRGEVTIPGHDAELHGAAIVSDVFERMVRHHEFDVAELGMGFHLRLLEHDSPFVAIPAFPNRVFRHSCVFVHADSGITTPQDLTGRRIGEFALYGQDSGIWAKGILADEYGFSPEANRWVIGGLDRPMAPFDYVPQTHPDGVEVVAEPDRALADMLETGEIDALFSSNVPQRAMDGSTRIRRLFPDYPAVERDWHRRTGLFPIMHTVVVRRDLLAEHPGLARAAYDGFLAAKDAAAARYSGIGKRMYQAPTMLPWMNALVDEDMALLGKDWWPYGVEANRPTIETFLRYCHEQGVTSRRFAVEELFAPELLDT